MIRPLALRPGSLPGVFGQRVGTPGGAVQPAKTFTGGDAAGYRRAQEMLGELSGVLLGRPTAPGIAGRRAG
ncbi:MAG: hypothetical protein WBA51_02420 [Erythrobacter sp.]